MISTLRPSAFFVAQLWPLLWPLEAQIQKHKEKEDLGAFNSRRSDRLIQDSKTNMTRMRWLAWLHVLQLAPVIQHGVDQG